MTDNFKLTQSSGEGRSGYLKINEKKIETPVVFFQYPFRNYTFFWKNLSIDALLVNAHYIMRKKALLNKIEQNGLEKTLNFNGIIMMDSGGHQIQKYGYAVDTQRITEIYESVRPDIGVVLDRPVYPYLSQSYIENAADYMIKNYHIMSNKTEVVLLPVIHGYSESVIRKCVKNVQSHLWGVGSLVPLMLGKSSNLIGSGSVVGIKRGKEILVKIVLLARKILGEEKFLHVFGIGSALTMHLMFFLGVDSVDSASYEWFARYGHIQVPGKGRINITGLANERCSENRKIRWKNYECGCPVCSNTSKCKLFEVLKKSKDARVIHNLYVHHKEVQLAREHIRENSYESFVEKRLRGTQFFKLFKLAKRWKRDLGV